MQTYSDPRRESEPYALPDVEIFYSNGIRDHGHWNEKGDKWENLPKGYYYWFCSPGCIPESSEYGPFITEKEAHEDLLEQHAPDDYWEEQDA